MKKCEVGDLRAAFCDRTGGAGADAGVRVRAPAIRELIAEMEDYEKVKDDDVRYVLAEAGLTGREDFDFHEFVEICAGLKEILFRPDQQLKAKKKKNLMMIPVEKSGGGV